jgi:hypothetical protein
MLPSLTFQQFRVRYSEFRTQMREINRLRKVGSSRCMTAFPPIGRAKLLLRPNLFDSEAI